jgi:hypothetical protein
MLMPEPRTEPPAAAAMVDHNRGGKARAGVAVLMQGGPAAGAICLERRKSVTRENGKSEAGEFCVSSPRRRRAPRERLAATQRTAPTKRVGLLAAGAARAGEWTSTITEIDEVARIIVVSD